MKKLPDVLRFSIILVILGILVGGLLPLVNEITYPIIEEKKLAAVLPLLEEVAPESDNFKDVTSQFRDRNRSIKMIFIGFDNNDTVNSVVYWVETTGYGGGAVETLVAIEVSEDAFLDVKVISAQGQTVGIGDVILTHDFNMVGAGVDENIDLIAGVTVSTTAVSQGVNFAATHFVAQKNTISGLER